MQQKPIKSEIEYITIKEACDIAKVSRQTLYEWRRDAMPFKWISVGPKIVRIEKESFIKFLQGQSPRL